MLSRYLTRGTVERLEVINKKWVRVHLLPGALEETLWFNIGSSETFERNLENAQLEMNLEPQNHVPVIYKNELEASQLGSYIPTLLTIGK